MNQYDWPKAKLPRLKVRFTETQYHILIPASYPYCLTEVPHLCMIGHHCFHPMKRKEKYNIVHALCELMGNLKVFLLHRAKLEGLSDTAQGIQGSRSSCCCSPSGNPFTLDATKPGDSSLPHSLLLWKACYKSAKAIMTQWTKDPSPSL